MITPTPPPFEAGPWRDLYAIAIIESDQDRIPLRIGAAEHAIVERARELFKVSGDHVEEEEAMDDALYLFKIEHLFKQSPGTIRH